VKHTSPRGFSPLVFGNDEVRTMNDEVKATTN